MSQPDDRFAGEIDSSDFDHILIEYPKLTLKHNDLVIFEAHLSPLDVVYLCENGVEKLTLDYVKKHHQLNFPEEEKNEPQPEPDTVDTYDEQGPSIAEGGYQETYLMLKPDALPRRNVGTIISKFQRLGLTLLNLQMDAPTKEKLEEHYLEHHGKDFYPGLIAYMLTGPVVKMHFGGKNAILMARKLIA